MAREISYRTPKRRLFSTPIPEETRTYKPVSHKELAVATLKGIRDAGFELEAEEYYSSQEGMIGTARYTIANVKDADMQLEIGWQNSYNKKLTVKFAIGTRILVCENGCVAGNFGSFARKHMGDVQTFAPEEMKDAILNAARVFDQMVIEKENMKSHIIGREGQFDLAGKLFFVNNDFSTRDLLTVKEEIDNPTHSYSAPGSIWEIYQYVTYAIKELHPTLWMDAHIKIHQFFLEQMEKHKRLNMQNQASVHWNSLTDAASERGVNAEDIIEMLEDRTTDTSSLAPQPDPAQVNLLDAIKEVEITGQAEEETGYTEEETGYNLNEE
jgi:hypothetical protein